MRWAPVRDEVCEDGVVLDRGGDLSQAPRPGQIGWLQARVYGQQRHLPRQLRAYTPLYALLHIAQQPSILAKSYRAS